MGNKIRYGDIKKRPQKQRKGEEKKQYKAGVSVHSLHILPRVSSSILDKRRDGRALGGNLRKSRCTNTYLLLCDGFLVRTIQLK
jgi:hypothetical protein